MDDPRTSVEQIPVHVRAFVWVTVSLFHRALWRRRKLIHHLHPIATILWLSFKMFVNRRAMVLPGSVQFGCTNCNVSLLQVAQNMGTVTLTYPKGYPKLSAYTRSVRSSRYTAILSSNAPRDGARLVSACLPRKRGKELLLRASSGDKCEGDKEV